MVWQWYRGTVMSMVAATIEGPAEPICGESESLICLMEESHGGRNWLPNLGT